MTTEVLPPGPCLLDPDPLDLGTSKVELEELGEDLDLDESPPELLALKASILAGSTMDLDFPESELFNLVSSDDVLDFESSDFELVLDDELGFDFSDDDCSVFCFPESGFDDTELDL